MRALRFHQARELAVEKVAEPGSPGSGEVLLRPALCGICGTDLHEYTDGPGVTHVRAGDLVTVMPLIHCGRCHECLRGQGHLCRTMACTGLSSAWGGL